MAYPWNFVSSLRKRLLLVCSIYIENDVKYTYNMSKNFPSISSSIFLSSLRVAQSLNSPKLSFWRSFSEV